MEPLWQFWGNVIAIIFSPIIAVCVTLWYQNREEKRKIKYSTFFALVSNRGHIPPTMQFVNALNAIELVFYGEEKIISAWHLYRDALYTKPFDDNVQIEANRKLLDLLKAIAKHLSYSDIEQTNLDKSYVPQIYLDQAIDSSLVQRELYTFLKNLNDTAQGAGLKKDA